ncbi:GL25775 [Drosophila persimilis]|uniref:Ras-related protein Rab-30 n=1 Tax=Drosophila persimilis TaxID=7234 RepID=B4GJZ6_DROPE|nr:ras-related protein Rab-30 [Drosophila persimilis]XP_026843763.1 ras-related protein Rab-30 [Drosophila persimilis]EDW36962.1 GL25775 [Drosophila persimilis]
MEDYKFLFKIVLVGNAGVGKTCLVRRFTQGLFPPGQGATIGVDFMIKTVEVEGEKIKLQIWDTAGQERFRSITQSYYRSAHALILVYDISCQPTFDCLPDWLREIQEYANSKVLKILVGNKTDRDDREIPTQIGEEFAKQHDMYFLETSAKEAENVERLFYEIAAELIGQARSKDGSSAAAAAAAQRQSDGGSIGLASLGAKAAQSNCCGGLANAGGGGSGGGGGANTSQGG